MKFYVVSDVHGYYSAFIVALAEAGWFKETQPKKLVLCGDTFSRGSEARELMNFLTELHKQGKLVYIKGDHDEILTELLNDVYCGDDVIDISASARYGFGIFDTAVQLSGMTTQEVFDRPKEMVRRVHECPLFTVLLPSSLNYYETSKYIFTHGWIPVKTLCEGLCPKYAFDPYWRNAPKGLWRKARWSNGIDMACKHHLTVWGRKRIVCGHITASYARYKYATKDEDRIGKRIFDFDSTPFYGKGFIAIDGNTDRTGKVNVLVIEDEEINSFDCSKPPKKKRRK